MNCLRFLNSSREPMVNLRKRVLRKGVSKVPMRTWASGFCPHRKAREAPAREALGLAVPTALTRKLPADVVNLVRDFASRSRPAGTSTLLPEVRCWGHYHRYRNRRDMWVRYTCDMCGYVFSGVVVGHQHLDENFFVYGLETLPLPRREYGFDSLLQSVYCPSCLATGLGAGWDTDDFRMNLQQILDDLDF